MDIEEGVILSQLMLMDEGGQKFVADCLLELFVGSDLLESVKYLCWLFLKT